jgi:hypothetical protein
MKNRCLIQVLLIFVLSINIHIIFSQNTGPVSPETVAFEPVDATDMVNLLTGDFAYVIPLLDVPGPEGGYPLALSYHGGIAVDQEASWVGLGWTLNPGAINRSVAGNPTDYRNVVKTLSFDLSNRIMLTTSEHDTIPLIGSNFCNMFGLSNSTNILLVFQKPDFNAINWIKLEMYNFIDETVEFEFFINDIENTPKLKINIDSYE